MLPGRLDELISQQELATYWVLKMETAIFWLLGIIASVVVTIFINDPIYFVMAKLLGGFIKRERGLGGIWLTEYDYESQGMKHTHQLIFVVRQFGRFVVAQAISDELSYKIQGKLSQQMFLTGTWEELWAQRSYYGAFQFMIKPTGNEMTGKWVGFNRESQIMHGSWNWKLQTTDTSKNSIMKFKTKISKVGS